MSTIGAINDELGRDQFLNLLVTQLRAQDPLDPIKNEDFIAQLSQFSTLEQVTQLNASFAEILKLTQLTQSASLIGRTVNYTTSSGTSSGVVDSLGVSDGAITLNIGSDTVPLDNVLQIS